MSRVDSIFASLRADGRRGLMPFVCAGYPSPGGLGAQLGALQGAGASIVEVGIPFSDPIADGPVIAAAMHEALVAGMTPARTFDEVRAARPGLDIGLVAMASVSLVHRDAEGAGFVAKAADAGFDGLIVPDLPLEESDRVRALAAEAGLICSLLVAPTTPASRAAAIARACTGFVYMLARTGITGERADAPEIERRVADLRRETDLPIACGFGISTPAHVRAVVRHADAAIVGSALIKRMGEASQAGEDPAAAGAALTAELSTGLSIP
jgi:tryptophan synthase alpha chain